MNQQRQNRITHRDGAVPVPIADARSRTNWRPSLQIAVLVLILAVGIGLRLASITRQDLWLDEAYSVYVAAHRFPQIMAFVVGSDSHPPLYYLLLHLWMFYGQGVLALRMLSTLASIGSLFLMYVLSRRLASQSAAMLATGLMALSAFQVWYAHEVRMYALTTLAILTAIYALVRAWQDEGRGAWIVFTGAMLAALYLDYSALYVYSALVIWFMIFSFQRPGLRRPFACSNLILFLGYLPWLPSLSHQIFQIGGLTAWISSATGTGLSHAFTNLLINRANLLQPDGGSIANLQDMLSLALLGAAFWLPRREPAYPLLATWLYWPCALGLVASRAAHPILIDRTIMVVQPAFFLLLAMSADRLWHAHRRTEPNLLRRIPAYAVGAPYSRLHRRATMTWLLRLLVALGLGMFVLANVRAQAISWHMTLKEDWSHAAALVATDGQSGDLVLFNAYFTQMPFDYYFHQDFIADVPMAESGYQLEESLLFENLMPPGPGLPSDHQLSDYGRVWLVLSHTDPATAVPPWLAGHFQLAGQWQFVGVTVQLYQQSLT